MAEAVREVLADNTPIRVAVRDPTSVEIVRRANHVMVRNVVSIGLAVIPLEVVDPAPPATRTVVAPKVMTAVLVQAARAVHRIGQRVATLAQVILVAPM